MRPAYGGLLLTSLSVKLLCIPVSSLNSTILLLSRSALVTLAIFRTRLFSHTCRLCCCSSVIANVSVRYRHTGVTHVLVTFSLVFLRSDGPPSPPQLLSTRSLQACALGSTHLSPSSCLCTLPLLCTRNCPSESVSSPPARCPDIPGSLYIYICLYRDVWIAAIASSRTSLATLMAIMCNTSQCELRSLRVNSGMLNVIRIVTYYTLPPLESPDSFWIAMAFSR